MNTLDWDDEPVKEVKKPVKKKAKRKPKAKKETETVSVSKKPLKTHVLNSNIYWAGSLSRFKKFNPEEYRQDQYRIIDVGDDTKHLMCGNKKIKIKDGKLAIFACNIVKDMLGVSQLESMDWMLENDFMLMRLIPFNVKEWDDKITIDDTDLIKSSK